MSSPLSPTSKFGSIECNGLIVIEELRMLDGTLTFCPIWMLIMSVSIRVSCGADRATPMVSSWMMNLPTKTANESAFTYVGKTTTVLLTCVLIVIACNSWSLVNLGEITGFHSWAIEHLALCLKNNEHGLSVVTCWTLILWVEYTLSNWLSFTKAQFNAV